MIPITYRTIDVNGLKVFYRESGSSDAPKLLLLHGFPSAGHLLIIAQNGNAYEEGLSDVWDPIRAYWREPAQANRDAIRIMLKPG